MKRTMMVVLGLAALGLAPGARAAGNIDCELRYTLSGWSAFYKTASGSGTVSCDNGARFPVSIRAKGGGLTVGRTTINDGHGRFTGAYSLDDLVGTYAAAEVHASASRASGAQVMTKGDVSLALAGTGQGWSLGVGFGKFVITRR
ncbi:hypothetical protein [Stenotrophomonas mori]|uniref:Secreted protein n=1 Tax=Stenotrophomonas mori TaxID=2871096 RepID=A0ABT0SEI3_9GAMM|nr:hypothetical protein [Stenotrophomonas mori]MCL7713708.1 hypothetical protein [Stenotrophomonas mori]